MLMEIPPPRLGINKKGVHLLKQQLLIRLPLLNFAAFLLTPPPLLCLSVFHYSGTLWMYYCINTFMWHQKTKILNAKKELGQSKMKLLGRLRKKKNLKLYHCSSFHGSLEKKTY